MWPSRDDEKKAIKGPTFSPNFIFFPQNSKAKWSKWSAAAHLGLCSQHPQKHFISKSDFLSSSVLNNNVGFTGESISGCCDITEGWLAEFYDLAHFLKKRASKKTKRMDTFHFWLVHWEARGTKYKFSEYGVLMCKCALKLQFKGKKDTLVTLHQQLSNKLNLKETWCLLLSEKKKSDEFCESAASDEESPESDHSVCHRNRLIPAQLSTPRETKSQFSPSTHVWVIAHLCVCRSPFFRPAHTTYLCFHDNHL